MKDPKPFGVNELREMFLHFFETKGHLRLPSFSLIPQNDASLLLINSGMAPMKPFFTGEQEPPRHRVTTCQKCIRTGDIENMENKLKIKAESLLYMEVWMQIIC